MIWFQKICIVGLSTLGVILFITPTTQALDCYVCRDCETSFNSSQVITCTKSTARCIKIVNENGVIDRTCGDSNKCGGRDSFQFPAPTQRPRRSISAVHADAPTRRKRALLDAPVQKQQGFKELTTLHCCNENECNRSLSPVASFAITLLLTCISTFLRNPYWI